MAVEVLAVQSVIRSGLTPAYTAANADGHTIVNDGEKTFFHVKNGSGAPIVCTFATTATADGLALADRTVSVTNAEERIVGPFPTDVYGPSLTVTFADVTSLTCGAFKLNG